jgi:hypothetical protein
VLELEEDLAPCQRTGVVLQWAHDPRSGVTHDADMLVRLRGAPVSHAAVEQNNPHSQSALVWATKPL